MKKLIPLPDDSPSNATRPTRGPLPNFLILGAQKCGTTSLAAALRDHPDVFMPTRKEAHHYGSVSDEAAGGEAYRAFFGEWQGEPYVGEASPSYLWLADAARQIARTLPTARFIVSLRNPVDRAYSAYWHGVRMGQYSLSFADVLSAEPRMLAESDTGWWALADTGRYLRQLLRYERLVGRDRLHVVLFDDLFGDAGRQTLEGIARFLGIAERDWQPLPTRNRNQMSWLPKRARRGFADVQRNSPIARRSFRATMSPFRPAPMAPFIRRALVEEFRVENEMLGCWLDRDLSAWNR